MFDTAGRQLRDRLLDRFSTPIDEPLDDDAFNDLALAVFRYQFERNRPLTAFCKRRRRTPSTVEHWTRIPAVPTAAFRQVALVAGDPEDAEAVFLTSGTTSTPAASGERSPGETRRGARSDTPPPSGQRSGGRSDFGAGRRGAHFILDLSIYHAALLAHFRARLLPDGATPRMIALMPPTTDMPDSSLAHMVQVVVDRLGGPGSRHVASTAAGLDTTSLAAALDEACDDGRPVCLLGTSFSFVHWLDHLTGSGERFRLPEGSRLMDTGGYKGRSRAVPAEELRGLWHEWLGIDPALCVNEYGMTELCSQFYDTSLEERLTRATPGPRRKVGPPWVRTRVVDPDTLEPVDPGATGLLQHFDLANLGSVVAIQTEDLGHALDDGFTVRGRAAGAPSRGCSIALDDLLTAARPE